MINENKNRIKTQKAMDYIVYMIVGSYFDGMECMNKKVEKKLFLFYKDIRTKRQYAMEEKCIRYVEHYIMKDVPGAIWNENVKVYLKQDEALLATTVCFKGKDFVLKVASDFIDGNNMLRHEMVTLSA